MDKLPSTIIQHIYAYDNTLKIKFGKVLKQLSVHGFIYNCNKCFKPWNNCYCYCEICRTYLKYCHQTYFDEKNTYEDELEKIIALTVWFKSINFKRAPII